MSKGSIGLFTAIGGRVFNGLGWVLKVRALGFTGIRFWRVGVMIEAFLD